MPFRSAGNRYYLNLSAGRLFAAVFLLLALTVPAWASRTTIQLAASPNVIIADGKSQTTITATVRAADGSLAPDGTVVTLSTSLGTLDHSSASTIGGVARASLTSGTTAGDASVMASTFLGGDSGAAEQSLKVSFTNDHDLVSTNGDSRWLRIDCPQYLVYSADYHVIEAQGAKGSASLRYGPITMKADSIQVDLSSLVVRAMNVTMTRGHESITAAEMRFDLYAFEGWAVLPNTTGAGPHSVEIAGPLLATTPLLKEYVDESIQNNPYRFVDLSSSRVVISARSIAADPASTIQFHRATIYSDGKKLVSMPFHEMPIQTDQLFGEQILGISSDGLFVNLPYYYHMSPNSTGTIYLRNAAVATAPIQSNLPPSLADASRPGLELDLLHTYRTMNGGNGSLVVNGMTSNDWGATWTHSQRLGPQTNAFFNVTSPNHRGIFATSTLNRQMKDFSFSMSMNQSNDPGIQGYSYSSNIVSGYLQSMPRTFDHKFLTMTTSLNWQYGRVSSTIPGIPSYNHELSTQGLSVHLNTPAARPDKHTSVSDGLTIGDSWDQQSHQSSPTLLATLGLNRTLPRRSTVNVNYSLQYDPLLSQYSASGGAFNSLALYKPSSVQQTVTMMMSMQPTKKLSYNFSGNYAMPYSNENFVSGIFYHANRDWALDTTFIYGHSIFGRYQSLRFGLSRAILNRTVTLSYDTDIHRFNFDFGAGQL